MEDMTEFFQELYGDRIKIDSAILNTETGIVDITITPVKPVEHINIIIKVNDSV